MKIFCQFLPCTLNTIKGLSDIAHLQNNVFNSEIKPTCPFGRHRASRFGWYLPAPSNARQAGSKGLRTQKIDRIYYWNTMALYAN